MASDRDQEDNGEFTYQLNDPEGAFSIDPRTGWLTVRNQVKMKINIKLIFIFKKKNILLMLIV